MIDYNIEQFLFLFDLYEDLYDWIATRTPLNYSCKSTFKYYHKNVWEKLKNKIDELQKRENLNDLEKDFLDCIYKGKAYRIMNYSRRNKGHIYPMEYFQSCSKTMNGIKKVKNVGEVLLIELEATSYGIDIFKLLEFMCGCGLINYKNEGEYRCFQNLERYINEEEIVIPITQENILKVSAINLLDNKKICDINEANWFRNSM